MTGCLHLFAKRTNSLGNPPDHEFRALMVTRDIFDTKAYVGDKSPVIVMSFVYRYVLAMVLTGEGFVGNLFREHHRHLGSAFTLPTHRKPVAGLGLVISGADHEYAAFVP